MTNGQRPASGLSRRRGLRFLGCMLMASVAFGGGVDGTLPSISAGETTHWAFQPLAGFAPPNVVHADRVRTPVDAFVLAKLEARGLGFSSDADRIALMRRAYFDLLGLPPDPREVDAFLSDDAPQAF